MKRVTRRNILAGVAGSLAVAGACSRQSPWIRRELKYAPAPAGNPMKGFVPPAGDWGDAFPHSLEWADFPLNAIMRGPGQFDFDRRFEETVAEIAARGHQAVLRVYLDYPGRPTGVPAFLIDAGLRMTRYEDHGGGMAPDYRNEDLAGALADFIGAFGERYDGDGRIAYITLGLLGFRGGWNTHPLDGLMADPATQKKIVTAYAKAFSRSRLLMRYPQEDAAKWPIGLHDDAFLHNTVGEGESGFLRLIQKAKADDLWKTQPIGGEVWREAQPFLWKPPAHRPPEASFQDFPACVRMTHATWLVNQSLFQKAMPDNEKESALAGACLLGYEFQLLAVEALEKVGPGAFLPLAFEIVNRGVAPLYAGWKIRLRLEGATESWETMEMPDDLQRILPDSDPHRWKVEIRVPDPLPAGGFRIRMIPPRAFPDAPPLGFANGGLERDGTLVLADYGSDGSLR